MAEADPKVTHFCAIDDVDLSLPDKKRSDTEVFLDPDREFVKTCLGARSAGFGYTTGCRPSLDMDLTTSALRIILYIIYICIYIYIYMYICPRTGESEGREVLRPILALSLPLDMDMKAIATTGEPNLPLGFRVRFLDFKSSPTDVFLSAQPTRASP